jgi:hypothetical protein
LSEYTLAVGRILSFAGQYRALMPRRRTCTAKVNSLRQLLALLPLFVLSACDGARAGLPADQPTPLPQVATAHPAAAPRVRVPVAPSPGALPSLGGRIAAVLPRLSAAGEGRMTPVANGGRTRGFYFTRAMYGGYGWRQAWATDFPKADLQFLTVLQRLLPTLDVYGLEHPVGFADPELRKFPYVYAVEVANMQLDTAEVRGLRDYLLAGGFLFVDDFWGTREWEAFEYQLRRVFPDRAIVDLPLDHPIFNTYYEIDQIVQVPMYRNACSGGPTWERDGYVPAVRAVLDDAGRVMVLISWNSDLGDAWEWAELSCYPLEYSTYAFQLAVNTIVYAMSR